MKDKAFQNAAAQLYNSGKASFDAYKYQDALDDLEQSYKYDKSYNTEYHIAMCYKYLNKNTDKAQEYFYDIISKGEVFKGESFDWMDDFKSYICNSTVDVLSRFIDTYSIEDEADRVIQIADQILLNDPCNEEALLYKIKALIYQNNFKLARYVYDRFCALYQEMYGEAFPSSFEQVVLPSKYYSVPAHWQDCAIAIVTPVPSLWQDRATVMACLCHPCGTPLPLQWQMYAPH